MKNKKAQVGTTLTWMIAFLVIFFIMLLFLVFTSALAAKNVLLVLNEGKNKIDISSSMNPLTSQRKLFYVLNYPLENNKTIKELIIFSSDETVKINIQKNATKILQTPDKIQNQEICYSFFIDKPFKKGNFNSAEINFFNNKKINVKLYSKKC